MAKLGEIKLKQIPQLNTANSSPLIRKHKEVLNLMMRTLSLDTYGLTWAQFIKGVGCGAGSFSAASARDLAAAMNRAVLSPESNAKVP